jgi:hypothetical protein
MGLRARLGPGGRLQVGPRELLTPEARALAMAHADEIREALAVYRVWRVTLADGTRMVAIRPAGATRADMLRTERGLFGDRLASIEPDPVSAVNR